MRTRVLHSGVVGRHIGRAPFVFALMATIVVLSMAPSRAQIQSQPDHGQFDRTIIVSGVGYVIAEPDSASITMGVASEAGGAKDAMMGNAATMTAVIEALKADGIESRDIQTTNLTVQPRYKASDGRGPALITGYVVSNQVRVVLKDLKRLGDVIDHAIKQGANQVNGIAFEATKTDALRDDARKRAVDNAIHKAKLFSEAAGVGLGAVIAIEEAGVAPSYRPAALARAAPMAAEAAPPPIESGSLRLEARVTITFALK